MKRVAVLLVCVLGVGIYGAFADTPKDPKAPEGIHFMHGNHKDPLAKIGINVDDPAQCKNCHTLDAKGVPLAPASQGHAPCMRSNCHAADFMVISEAGKKNKPQEFARASAFCTGCHPTVPWPWKKPQVLTIQAWRNQREHHIEMAKYGDPPRGMDHFPLEFSSADEVTIDTGTIVQGMPIGTNTTGQEAEGPHCVGAADH